LDFELLTGSPAQAVDLGELEPEQLAERCSRRPDVVILSPPCKGFSGCLPEPASKTTKYRDLNNLALRTIDLVLEAWTVPPAFILLENVPRMRTRGAELLDKIKVLLRAKGYETDLRTHDCGELGGLAQSRERVLLVARHPGLAPTPLLKPDPKPLRPMSSVLWSLPVPTPDSHDGGSMHLLPRLSALNWVRIAAIRAGNDWRDIPKAIRCGGSPTGRQSGLYGVGAPDRPGHAVVGAARAGSHSWACVADPRLPDDDRRHAGKYGVQDDDQPSHTVISEARTGKGWSEVADPRLTPRAARQNGGFGVNAPGSPSHSVVAEGSVRNTWAGVADPRLDCHPRRGTMGIASAEQPSKTVIGSADVHNSTSAVADPRVKEQRRGNFGVEDPSFTGRCVRAHCGFGPTHQLWASEDFSASRDAWTSGTFSLVGPALDLGKKGRPCHVIIAAPDGTVHRPLTTLELAVLQGLPAWHTPRDPTELELGADGGQWLTLTGGATAAWRERIGNAVPPPTAQAIAGRVLEILDAGASETFQLSAAGIWVSGLERSE
jgi:site-specific DNA-cytosine methylase